MPKSQTVALPASHSVQSLIVARCGFSPRAAASLAAAAAPSIRMQPNIDRRQAKVKESGILPLTRGSENYRDSEEK
jgi:hypothetical protein